MMWQSDHELNAAAMRFPPGHAFMKAARERTAAALTDARWGDTGPRLLTALLPEYAPRIAIAPRESTYAIGPDEFQKFLLPQAREEIEERIANSSFVHLWNEMWRKAGVPKTIAPPKGCWLDLMFERHDVPVAWSDRLDAASIERWAALRRDRDHAGHYNLVHDRELNGCARSWTRCNGRNLPELRHSSVTCKGALAAGLTDRANPDLTRRANQGHGNIIARSGRERDGTSADADERIPACHPSANRRNLSIVAIEQSFAPKVGFLMVLQQRSFSKTAHRISLLLVRHPEKCLTRRQIRGIAASSRNY
jgi:hypothetical protein